MPLQAPNLDDRQCSDIVAEAKTLIPRYAPEWTNFNESDPGITLRTQLAAASGAGTPILFETDEALVVIGAVLAAIQTFDGFGYTVQTEKNGNTGQSFHPFGQNPRIGNALMIGFRSPVAFPQDQINLAVRLATDNLTRPVIQCAGALPPPARLAWEFWNGSLWVSLDLDSDGTRAFSQDGHILFPGPGSDVVIAALGNVSEKLYWIRARI